MGFAARATSGILASICMRWNRAVESREEGRVEVDLEEVLVVPGVAGAEQVHRPVGARERVHECREGAAGHAEEGVADRETLRAGEDDVLEDVRDTGRVRWRRREK